MLFKNIMKQNILSHCKKEIIEIWKCIFLFYLCLFQGIVLVIFPFALMTYHNESALIRKW